MKVQLYGDSLMRGTVIEKGERYRSVIGEMLERLGQCFGLCFTSRAHFGSTIEKGWQNLQKDLARGLSCDFAVVEFGGNDCSFDWQAVAEDPAGEHPPFTTPERFEALLGEMATRLQQADVTPVLMTLPPIDATRHLQFIGKTEEGRRNILQWLGDVQMIYRFHELYSNIVAGVAKKTGSILVDVRRRFLDRHDYTALVGSDGVHLTREGYALVCQAFADFVAARRQAPATKVFC
ncbi:SGNH/GDSL hydrolase family protein [Ruminococcaceae bacterium OttesenSCG-928-O06]|nr:SGNH/GDSL hydrolase family protein [Ruminococcaceae bacterium OttesenSCG-928-O06]